MKLSKYILLSCMAVMIIAGVLVLFPALATADCQDINDGTINNSADTIECTGSDTNGVNAQGGIDTITVDGNNSVSNGIGAGINAGNGDDNVTVTDNASVTSGTVAITGGDGQDTIIITGDATVIGVLLSGVAGGNQNDEITIGGNATVAGGANAVNGGGGSDTITVTDNATIASVGDGIDADAGSDEIRVEADATILAGVNAIQGGAGNDTVTIVIGADITGEINGGAGNADVLRFEDVTNDEAAYNQAVKDIQELMDTCPCSGSFTFNGHTYHFSNFEQYENLIQLVVIPVIPPTEPEVVIPVVVNGVTVNAVIPYDAYRGRDNTVFALRRDNALTGEIEVFGTYENEERGFLVASFNIADLAGEPQQFQSESTSRGWYIVVYYLGKHSRYTTADVYQVNVYNENGDLWDDSLIFTVFSNTDYQGSRR